MKIIESKNNEFKFDNGAWVAITVREGDDEGSWEYQYKDDEETYLEGGLWFDDKELEDYDGCYELPDEVQMALRELGYEVNV